MFEKYEIKHLDKFYKIIMIIWLVIYSMLPIYFLICKFLEARKLIGTDPDLPIEIIGISLIAVTVMTLLFTYFIRKKILKTKKSQSIVSSRDGSSISLVHQVVARYTAAIVISSALAESVGVYGLVIFLLSQNTAMLYQFLFVSAVAMYYFRPRKSELLDLAAQMKSKDSTNNAGHVD